MISDLVQSRSCNWPINSRARIKQLGFHNVSFSSTCTLCSRHTDYDHDEQCSWLRVWRIMQKTKSTRETVNCWNKREKKQKTHLPYGAQPGMIMCLSYEELVECLLLNNIDNTMLEQAADESQLDQSPFDTSGDASSRVYPHKRARIQTVLQSQRHESCRQCAGASRLTKCLGRREG